METIFDKPLDKQVASNTQAIANLEEKTSSETGSGTSLSCVSSVTFNRSAGFVRVKVEGLSSLPNGGWTNICNIPSGFIPVSGSINVDYIANTNDQCSSIRLLRFRANIGGTLQVYNYGPALTYANFSASFIYPI